MMYGNDYCIAYYIIYHCASWIQIEEIYIMKKENGIVMRTNENVDGYGGKSR
mgnify:CR=1 FL=1